MNLVTDYINELGGYEVAKKKNTSWLLNHGENWRNVKDATLLEYRRQHNIFEIKDIVFLKDRHYSEMWFITNILPDGSIELKTATHGYPVPNRCWGMYYGKAEGLQHATDDEIHSRQRKAPT